MNKEACEKALQEYVRTFNASQPNGLHNYTLEITELTGDKCVITYVSETQRKAEREELKKTWVAKQNKKYIDDPDAAMVVGDEVTGQVILLRRELKSGRYVVHTGEARCNLTDQFDIETGVAVAYARVCGEPIPDYI